MLLGANAIGESRQHVVALLGRVGKDSPTNHCRPIRTQTERSQQAGVHLGVKNPFWRTREVFARQPFLDRAYARDMIGEFGFLARLAAELEAFVAVEIIGHWLCPQTSDPRAGTSWAGS